MSTKIAQEMISLTLVFDGGNTGTIEVPGGITWKECKELCEEKGMKFPTKNYIVQQYKTKSQWVDETILPTYSTGEKLKIIATVQAKETSGGADLPYKEVKAKIKVIIETSGEEAKSHFNADKNYTNKSTAELNKLYSEWKPEKSKSKKAVTPVLEPEIVNVEEVTVIEENIEEISDNTLEQDLELATNLTKQLFEIQKRISIRLKDYSIYIGKND